jgi:uncharacterized membrane protein
MDESSRNGAAEPTTDLPRGAAFMVCGGFMFAAMGAAVKLLSARFGNPTVVFLRSALGLLILLPWLARVGRAGIRTNALGEHLVRGVAGLFSMYCFFFVIARLRLADAVLLNYSAPLFVPFIERAWLGEDFSPKLWRGIAIGSCRSSSSTVCWSRPPRASWGRTRPGPRSSAGQSTAHSLAWRTWRATRCDRWSPSWLPRPCSWPRHRRTS